MSFEATALVETATAVVALGSCQADIDLLDDDSVQGGMRLIREHEQELQRYKLWLAASISRRSDYTFGYQGLARKSGFQTPTILIQALTGSSKDEAAKLARLGAMAVEAEAAAPLEFDEHGQASGGSSGTALITAAASGGITLDCVDAIRRGLGEPDAVVTAEQLRVEAERLIAHAGSSSVIAIVTPEELRKLARQARERLDVDAVERGQKERSAARAVRTWERDGFAGGSWKIPIEDGGGEINTALKLALANKTDGPRFPHTDADGNPVDKTAAETAIDDDRSVDQILADAFTQIFLNGLHADPSVVPGAQRAAVRVVVTEKVLIEAKAGTIAKAGTTANAGTMSGTALLEGSLSAITFSKLEEYLCEGGTVGILFNDDGTIDVGREQRLFTPKQRAALAVRDGGCRFPGCIAPPSWTEAHHVAYWARERGRTDIINGILLCRFHHMFIHDGGWEIVRKDAPGGGSYWLRPPESVDPARQLIEMPSKNPIVAAMKYAQSA